MDTTTIIAIIIGIITVITVVVVIVIQNKRPTPSSPIDKRERPLQIAFKKIFS